MSIENQRLISIINENQKEFEDSITSLDSSKLIKGSVFFGTTKDKKTGKVEYFYTAKARI